MIFEPKAKRKTKEFVKYIGSLSQEASDRIIEAFGSTEKQTVQKFIADTDEYIGYNEWGIGLENLLHNLYEISFPIDEKALLLAKEALKECGMNLEKWKFIDELKKLKRLTISNLQITMLLIHKAAPDAMVCVGSCSFIV